MTPAANIFGIAGLTPGGLGIWGLLLTVIGGLLLARIKVWPRLRELTIGEDAMLRKEMREELTAMRAELVSAKAAMVEVTARCTASDLRVSQLEFALQIATDEIARLAPDSTVPAQIRRLLAVTMPTPFPSGISQTDMDILRRMA